MTYARKTIDRYDIDTNYGYGWETECSEETLKEAKQRKKEYLKNTNADVRIVKRRERIGA